MLKINNTIFKSRLFLGTGKFSSNEEMLQAIYESESELVTLSIRRMDLNNKKDEFLTALTKSKVKLLPNTSGANNAKEAIIAANLAREALHTNWIKLEIHPEKKYLLPDPIETLYASEKLVKAGFVVLPYCSPDPVLCHRLAEVGCSAIMPLGAPIGSNQGLPCSIMTDRELLQVMCVFRIIFPEIEISLSTRESEKFRDNVATILINNISAGSKTQPGGYITSKTELEQFSPQDHRSPKEIANILKKKGLSIIWKDWDYYLGRK
uniref:thiazole synthase n=1 Tax=Glossina pallidipes TaxID=7398 RepID=A0A1A9Z166_GLOPL